MLKQWFFIATLSLLCGVSMLMVSIKQSEPIEIPSATTTTIEPSESIGTYLITKYSSIESCFYPKDGQCLVADGYPISFNTIACPRQWKLGTKFLIDGQEYICRDRYALYLSDRFDIWAGYGWNAYLEAKEFGIKYLEIRIIE